MPRINLASLAKIGVIKPGDEFVWKRKSYNRVHRVVLTQNYLLRSGDKLFRTPSSAARSFNDNKPVNGWLVWKLLDHNTSLENLRSKFNLREFE
jgi:hypothetical protein